MLIAQRWTQFWQKINRFGVFCFCCGCFKLRLHHCGGAEDKNGQVVFAAKTGCFPFWLSRKLLARLDLLVKSATSTSDDPVCARQAQGKALFKRNLETGCGALVSFLREISYRSSQALFLYQPCRRTILHIIGDVP